VREGRRVRWFNQVLAPLRGTVPDADLDRVVAGLSLLVGGDALVVMRDVCGLDATAAADVAECAARTLLATLER
jgi:hypothetical protein